METRKNADSIFENKFSVKKGEHMKLGQIVTKAILATILLSSCFERPAFNSEPHLVNSSILVKVAQV